MNFVEIHNKISDVHTDPVPKVSRFGAGEEVTRKCNNSTYEYIGFPMARMIFLLIAQQCVIITISLFLHMADNAGFLSIKKICSSKLYSSKKRCSSDDGIVGHQIGRCFHHLEQVFGCENTRNTHTPIGSMGLVYLPTFTM